ncbi:PQQ-dependent sugar dehydrogenase [Jiulongibacter sp. NS-SX5]|uniref:PQQ-dependent sugar dehydrogenase n=1 Tax=Jiulongibacter sp. NS-SX5 TaxID=3463854 RepID=UPI00405A0613
MSWRISFLVILVFFNKLLLAQNLTTGFESKKILGTMQDPASFAFAPDGRLFYGERITGQLRVADWNASHDQLITKATPFHTFNVPAARHRSSGLRGFVFDPDFVNNGYIYVFYMQDNPRHNRVVRIQASANLDISTGTETVLMDIPFSSTTSSGSHNGGDIVFGADAKLYFTTGDGWNGGDNVQSLNTYTGKVMRINTDGSIPSDNPFYNQTTGDFRAIYALGLRNPYSVSNLSASGKIYINDAVGSNKATVYEVAAGANYGHDGYNGIGTSTSLWADMSVNGEKVIAGGAWYPSSGYWPAEYHGNYFAAFWGSNSANAPGAITRALSESNTSKSVFYDNILVDGELKPVMLKLGLDENLYFLMTDYETGVGEIHQVSWVGTNTVTSPSFNPLPGQYDDPVSVTITNADPGSSFYYTLDGSDPSIFGIEYTGSLTIDTTTELRAIAILSGKDDSGQTLGTYTIGPLPNIPPIAVAVPKITGLTGQTITLNGSNSYDPDGSSLTMQEQWTQTGGEAVIIQDADETVANFTPVSEGIYEFKLVVEDIKGDKDSAFTQIMVYQEIADNFSELVARWSFEEDGNRVFDSSPNAFLGTIEGAERDTISGNGSLKSIGFYNSNDRVSVGSFDITGDELSICLWAKLNSYSQSDARFISKAVGQNDVDHYWMLSTLDGSKFRFRLKTENGGTATLISSSGEVPLNQWVFLAAVYDGSSMKIFRDSTEIGSLSKSGLITSNPNSSIALGNQPENATGGVRPLDGHLDEVRIYSKALSLAEVKEVMMAGFQKSCWKTLTVDQTDLYGTAIEVDEQLVSTSNLASDQTIYFKAGNSIELKAPFETNEGAVFTSEIEGCSD